VIGPRGLVTELIEAAIAAEPGVTMVPFDPRAAVERPAGERRGPDVVVVIESSGQRGAESWRELMAAGPGIRILTVDAARGTGIEYEMRPHAVLLGEVSPEDIVSVIRRMAASRSTRRSD
jgi:chemotaxis response regulator CheB